MASTLFRRSGEPGLPQLRDAWVYGSTQRGGLGHLPAAPAEFVVVARASVRRGRTAFDELPAPGTVTVVAAGRPPQPGDRFDLNLWDPVDLDGPFLFAGEVTSVSASVGPGQPLLPPDAEVGDIELDDESPVVEFQAVDQLARIYRRVIGAPPWPAEDPTLRCQRILLEAQATLDGTGPYGSTASNGMRVLGVDVDRRRAGELLEELMESTGGVLVARADTSLTWWPLTARGAQTPELLLPADVITGAVTWTARDEDKITRAYVEWGTPADAPPGSDPDTRPVAGVVNGPAEVYGSAGASIDPREVDVDSILATEDGAQLLANELVGRRSLPLWRMSPLVIDMRAVLKRHGEDLYRDVALVQPETLLEVAGLPAMPRNPTPGPQPTSLVWVVGTQHDIDGTDFTVTWWVEPWERLADPPRWDAPVAEDTWGDVPSWVSWVTSRSWQRWDPESTWLRVPSTALWSQNGTTTWTDVEVEDLPGWS